MRFLADESCDFAVVRALRAQGHDTRAIAEAAPQAQDPEVIHLAAHEHRVLLTEDKDFGQLVYAGSSRSSGVMLLRFPAEL
jgi:predicted nuclease of predicted toxin-antitoxin system